jgi:hypothetical protein
VPAHGYEKRSGRVQDDLDRRFGNVDRKKKKLTGKNKEKEANKPDKKLTFVSYARYKNGEILISSPQVLITAGSKDTCTCVFKSCLLLMCMVYFATTVLCHNVFYHARATERLWSVL